MSFRRRKQREADLERELRSDLELEAAEQQAHGLSAADARYAAQRALGNTALLKEDVRAAWGGRWIEDFFKDLRVTLRQWRKAPGFTATAILSLALGIGGTTAVFTLIDAVLLKSLPVRDPAALVLLGDGHGSGTSNGEWGSFSLYSTDLYNHLAQTGLFSGLAAMQSTSQNLTTLRRAGWSEVRPVHARVVSGNYFDVLGVRAALGRALTPADDSASAAPVAVVSDRYWTASLASDPAVVGSNVEIGGVPITVVGIGPANFYGETLTPDPPAFWLPLSADRLLERDLSPIDDPDTHWLYLLGRLAPGVPASRAQTQLTALLQNWMIAREGNSITDRYRKKIAQSYIQFTPGGSGVTHMQRDYEHTLRLLLGISIAVLLITCANIANLLLARGTARTSETSLRLALGASRGRLIRQSLTESLALALAGGICGLFAAGAGTKLLIALFFRGSDFVPILTTPDLTVLAFTLLLSCGAAIVFGLLPATRSTAGLAAAMRGSSVGIKGSMLGRRRFGIGPVLVAAEVALSLVVLAGAATFARSLANLIGQQFGFNPEHVLAVNIDTAHAGYNPAALDALYRRMHTRLNALPGVTSASISFYSPFNACCSGFTVTVQGYTPPPGEQMSVMENRVSPGYFQTIGTRLLLGRDINDHDTPASPLVAVVNEEFVRRFLKGQNPIGHRLAFGGGRTSGWLEIVGVVADAKYTDPRHPAMPMAFKPFLQQQPDDPAAADDSNFANVIEVRTAALDPSSVAAGVRRAVAEIDPRLPILRVAAVTDHVSQMFNRENVIATLAEFFALVALVLCCLGLYGLMAYSVQRRTREIGIRIALGARRHSVTAMVVRESLVEGLAGIVFGVPAAFGALTLVASQLYDVDTSNPVYAIAAAAILLLCIAIAGYIPARRASRIDPLIALRYE